MIHLVVTGRTGQLASELQQLPLPPGWRLTCTDRQTLDLMRPELFAEVLQGLKPDLIINAAAYTAVDQAESEPDIAMQVNAAAPGELARVTADMEIPFIHVSTDYVFSGKGGPWLESSSTEPVNTYGLTKRAGERAVMKANTRGVIVRTSWIFSRFGRNFVKTMARLAAGHGEIPVVADQYGGPTAAHDVAVALLKIAQTLVETPEKAKPGVFHFCGTPTTTWAGLAQAVFDHAGTGTSTSRVKPISSAEFDSSAARPLNGELVCTLIRDVYGIDQPDWRLALPRVLQQLKHLSASARSN